MTQGIRALQALEELESEAIFIMREVAAQFERPALLYSVGKDSSVLLRLAQKAFHPGRIPFALLHIDTGFNFPEMYELRDRTARELGVELIVHRNEEAIARGANPFDLGTQQCCATLQTSVLLDAIKTYGFDAAIGGARRDEERSRAKERVFSFRDQFGQWDPRAQRPELWSTYNGKIRKGESIRVFPLSNWTELDIWHYILVEEIPIVPLYFAARRKIVRRGGQMIAVLPHMPAREGEQIEETTCRFRTLGCVHCTGAVDSSAVTMPDVLVELFNIRVSERSTRVIDHDSDASMEMKKREGYF